MHLLSPNQSFPGTDIHIKGLGLEFGVWGSELRSPGFKILGLVSRVFIGSGSRG